MSFLSKIVKGVGKVASLPFKATEQIISHIVPHQSEAERRAANKAVTAQIDYYRSQKDMMSKESQRIEGERNAEKKRITLEIAKVEAELIKVNTKLEDPSFIEKVPPAVLEDHRHRHARWSEKLRSLRTTLTTLG